MSANEVEMLTPAADTPASIDADEENAISSNQDSGNPEVVQEDMNAPSDEDEEQLSVAELTTLPVASPVQNQTSPELLERLRQLQEQQRDRERQIPSIPHALPRDLEAEARATRRSKLLYAGLWLLALALVGIVIGATVGTVNRRAEPARPVPQEFEELKELISSVAFDGGASLEVEESPQHRALLWLSSNENLQDYPDGRRIQRYVLAVLYYSMNGDNWIRNDGWLSDEDECSWYRKAQQEQGPFDICFLNTSIYGIITLANNNLYGSTGIPPELALLSNHLVWLDLHLNRLNGAIATEIGRLTRVDFLDFSSAGLSGTIPTELGMIGSNSSFDVALNLQWNSLAGTIPSEIVSIPRLGALELSKNYLSGSLPTEVGVPSGLIGLGLFQNELTGSLPSQIGQLSALGELLLYDNRLTGTIPSEIALLSNLSTLSIHQNLLSGSIPISIGALTNVAVLQLNSNSLNGTIPSGIGNLSKLEIMYLNENLLSATIPTEVGLLSNLNQIWLNKTNITGAIPSEFGLCSSLTTMNFRDCSLSGTIPVELSRLSTLTRLSAAFNSRITGSLPTEIGLWTNLVLLDFERANLRGSIPSEIGLMTAMLALALSGAGITGDIPTEIGLLTNLMGIFLDNVGVTGVVPSEVASLRDLAQLRLNKTRIAGTLPSILMKEGSPLNMLVLEDSLFSGTIPSSIGRLDRLKELSFANNRLSGTLPSELLTLTNLELLQLYGNSFTGPFTCPDVIGECLLACNRADDDTCKVLL